MNNLEALIKSITTLTNLVTTYLFITWSYEGLSFLARSLFQ